MQETYFCLFFCFYTRYCRRWVFCLYFSGSFRKSFLIDCSNMCIDICMRTDTDMHVSVCVTRKFPSCLFLYELDTLTEVTVNTREK